MTRPRSQLPDVVQLRLRNQQIAWSTFDRPGDVVRWFGAVQAQDVKEALWAVGLRTRGASEVAVEAAIARREIVRTWPMRRTLHFVSPNDIRWMLDLLAPRLESSSAARHRWLELDARVFAQAEKICERVLGGGTQLTRTALYAAFASAGISTAESRGLHIVAHLSQRGVLCHGPRSGKDHTFVLLEEWAPTPKGWSGRMQSPNLHCAISRVTGQPRCTTSPGGLGSASAKRARAPSRSNDSS